jgi:hypothetical protein
MKARPILFSKPMVRALLAGTKTQTRRVIKGIPAHTELVEVLSPCPYGEPGDLLWVRESWAWPGEEEYLYRADPGSEELVAAWRADPHFPQISWKPSIHMPRLASRLTLRVTDVRVEQLQSISLEDARAEGMSSADPVADYRLLWEVIHSPGAWRANPWLWVIGFEVIAQNVEKVAA